MLDLNAINDRISFIIGVVFTNLALRFSLGDAVPQVPHSTLLDYYQNACIGMMLLMCFSHILLGALAATGESGSRYERFTEWLRAIGRFNLSSADSNQRRSLRAAVGTPVTAEENSAADAAVDASFYRLVEAIDMLVGIFFLASWLLFNIVYWLHVWRMKRRTKRDCIKARKDELIDHTMSWAEADTLPPKAPGNPTLAMSTRLRRTSTKAIMAHEYTLPSLAQMAAEDGMETKDDERRHGEDRNQPEDGIHRSLAL